MEKPLQSIINRGFKKDMESLYGKGAKVCISQVIYSTQNKNVIIHVKLYVSDFKIDEHIYPVGINLIVSEAWKMFSIDCQVRVVNSIDLIT